MQGEENLQRFDQHPGYLKDGSFGLALNVFCPVAERSVAVRQCKGCPYCEGIFVCHELGTAVATCQLKEPRTLLETEHSSGARSAPNGTEGSQLPHLKDAPISEIMTRDVVCVDPEMTVVDLRTLLLERNISGAPVVDAVGRPIGVVSKTDLVRALQEPDLYRTVRSIMMSLAFTLTESAPIARAAALMAYERVHRVVVISTEGSVVGIVSSRDVLNWLAQENGYLVRPRCA